MGSLVLRRLWLAGLLMNFSLAHAQAVPPEASPPPPQAPSSIFFSPYLSIFTRYQSYQEVPLSPWREANDNVGRIGGWRFYAREAQQPDADEPARRHPSNEALGTDDDHAGHGGKE